MNKRQLKKVMQREFNDGASLASLFEKYQNEDISEKKFSRLIVTLKDYDILEKYKIPYSALVLLMGLLTLLTAVAGYGIGIEAGAETPLYWCAVALFPLMFLYGFVTVNFEFYFGYLLLSISQFPRVFKDWGNDPITDYIALALTLGMIFLVWFLKAKLFPYMGFWRPKRTESGEYAFNMQEPHEHQN